MTLVLCTPTVTANIVEDCDNLPKAGLKSLGLLFNKSEIPESAYTRDANNKRKITGITLPEGVVPIAVFNPKAFEGSGSELSTESAYNTYTKNVMVSIPNIGADASKNIIEPLTKNNDGFVLILQRMSEVADGGFIIIGSETGAKATAAPQSLTDPVNNGMVEVTLTETGAQYAEVCLTGATYAAALATWNALVALVS